MIDPGLWWREQGRGNAIVLVPGGPGHAGDYMDPLASQLASDARVIQYDPRGCGRSTAAIRYSLSSALRDLEGIRAAAGVERWVVVGHSAGATLAIAYAIANPKTTVGIVCIAGGAGIHDDREWHAAYEAGRRLGRDQGPDTRFAFNSMVNRQMNASWRRYIKHPRMLQRIARLSVPLVAVHGELDIRPSWPMEQIATVAKRGQFVRIPGAGHIPWVSHGHQLRSLIVRFAQDLG